MKSGIKYQKTALPNATAAAYFYALLFITTTLFSQTLDPKLIATCGYYAKTATMSISYSVGEPATTTISNSTNHLTQGFQQPKPKTQAIELNVVIKDVSCIGANNGYAVAQPQNGKPPFTYTWMPYGGNKDTSSFLPPGTYTVTVTDSTKKAVSKVVTIKENQADCGFKIYTGLTPNGDGDNDCWIIEKVEEFAFAQVTIYNRYGVEVWSSKTYNNQDQKWCATNQQGNDLIAGTYYYVIKLPENTFTGWVEISR